MYDHYELTSYRKINGLSIFYIVIQSISILSALGQYLYYNDSFSSDSISLIKLCIIGFIISTILSILFLLKRKKNYLIGALVFNAIFQIPVFPTSIIITILWILYFALSKKCSIYFTDETTYQDMLQREAANRAAAQPFWAQSPVTQSPINPPSVSPPSPFLPPAEPASSAPHSNENTAENSSFFPS